MLHHELINLIDRKIKVNLVGVDPDLLEVCGGIGCVVPVSFHILLCLLFN
jgi:hypothetical protein